MNNVSPLLPPNASTARAELARALQYAVAAEARFGNRQDTRAELDQRWLKVADLILSAHG